MDSPGLPGGYCLADVRLGDGRSSAEWIRMRHVVLHNIAIVLSRLCQHSTKYTVDDPRLLESAVKIEYTLLIMAADIHEYSDHTTLSANHTSAA